MIGEGQRYAAWIVIRVTVQAHPGARHERIQLLPDDSIAVWVRARPVEGQANVAIERAIATALQVRASAVKIVAGGAGRRKILDVDLPDLKVLHERLMAHALRSAVD